MSESGKITRRDFIKGSAAMAIASVGLVPTAHAHKPGTKVPQTALPPTHKDVVGRLGMVTSTNALATRAGQEILHAGGNAVDAAVATALALCVVQPSSNGVAGYGGAMVIYLAKEKRAVAIDYNCRAPRAAREDMYKLDMTANPNEGEFPPVVGMTNEWGPMAVSVPGTIAGLSLAARKYGKLGWAKCMQPALRLAAHGVALSPGLQKSIAGFAKCKDTQSVHAILPDGRVPEVGAKWIQPDLAKLMEVLAGDPDSFYHGDVARRIAKRVRSAGGILTEQDMADYQCVVSTPLTLDYKGVRLHAVNGMTGSTCAFETLAVMQQLAPERRKSADPKYWADFADALTLAWRDRLKYVGDVPGIEEKIRDLISEAHTSELAKMVREGKVAKGPGGADPLKETVHLSTCDKDRNVVSLTQTNGDSWGTRFGIPGLGIVIGHGMSRFDPRPGQPNSPGSWKRPLHNMSPIILTKDDKPFGAVGLPGGRMIPCVAAGLVMDLVDFGMSPAEAVNAPRIHTEGGPISCMNRLPKADCDAMTARGHKLRTVRSIGGAASVIVVGHDRVTGCAQANGDAASGV